MSIRKLISNILTETFIQEGAKDFIDLGPNVGLITTISNNGQLYLNFLDFSKKKCIGTITLRNDGSLWYVTTVSAEDGFGPLMYKSGMMSVYPDKICPSRLDTPSKEAINVWYKFFINSGEAKKDSIPEDDIMFKDYGNYDLNIILNQSYSRPRSTWFNKILQRGEELSKKTGITPEVARNICSNYFREKYHNR